MRKSAVIEILARRLRILPSRIHHIADRLGDADVVSKTSGSKRFPPDLSEPEIVALVVGVIADAGLGNSVKTVETFTALPSSAGTFGNVLQTILFGPHADIGHLIVRNEPAGISTTINGSHFVFGAEASEKAATKARIIPGDALIAIAAELQGQQAQAADAVVELIKIRRMR
ncbi:hypothetical protein EDF68_103327 [Ochrobactrum sp. BH3]|nr:hypothetical protein EDF68_103327 [Ochrobactrum sp. BH3]